MSPTLATVSKQARIGVLCGGLSNERPVSLRSGKNCFEALQRLGYENVFMLDVQHDAADQLKANQIEVAFLALHGRYAEDGCIQGLLEWLGIPYTGNRVEASAVTMNKTLTKTFLEAAGLPVLPSIACVRGENFTDIALKIDEALTYPLMVKPASEGSSIGMSKVNSPKELEAALKIAFESDPHVLIENFCKGKDITIGVFDRNGTPTVTPILEMRPKKEWYDYEAKYTEGLTEFIIPAELPEDVTEESQCLALHAHQVMGCYGVSRTDFVVSAEGHPYILEVNTIPGMTALSDLPAQAQAMGIGYDELVDALLQTAIRYPAASQLVAAS